MTNKYRKKPLIIEAIQLTRNFFEQALEFVPEKNRCNWGSGEFAEDACYIEIVTLEGTMEAHEGDYIIKGIKGEFYPCQEDIFNLTYEKVQEQ